MWEKLSPKDINNNEYIKEDIMFRVFAVGKTGLEKSLEKDLIGKVWDKKI